MELKLFKSVEYILLHDLKRILIADNDFDRGIYFFDVEYKEKYSMDNVIIRKILAKEHDNNLEMILILAEKNENVVGIYTDKISYKGNYTIKWAKEFEYIEELKSNTPYENIVEASSRVCIQILDMDIKNQRG